MRLYRCWVEDYEVQEQVHATSVSHVREGEGTYDGTHVLDHANGLDTPRGGGGKGGGKGKTKTKTKTKTTTTNTTTKKEKTEDQLARAVV